MSLRDFESPYLSSALIFLAVAFVIPVIILCFLQFPTNCNRFVINVLVGKMCEILELQLNNVNVAFRLQSLLT